MRPFSAARHHPGSQHHGPAKNLLDLRNRPGRKAPKRPSRLSFAVRSPTFLSKPLGPSRFRYTRYRIEAPIDGATPITLAGLVARLEPDVIQTHAVKSHFLARRAGLLQRAPWVAFHHGYTWPAWRARLYNEFDRWSLRAAVKVLTVSRRSNAISSGVHILKRKTATRPR